MDSSIIRVKKIISLHLDKDVALITEETSLADDLGADSLEIMEIVMAFEDEFGVDIKDDAIDTIVTVGDAVKYIDGMAA